MNHVFKGKWISDGVLSRLEPRNVFFRQLERVDLPREHTNSHVLFRRRFTLPSLPACARVYLSADDYYKLYINGVFVGQGPAPSYHFKYNYNVIDVTAYLSEGENVIAVHTLYQGLVNRVWQSGDLRHGLILDLVADGETVICSDESFKTARHASYEAMGTAGYETQFLERYDSRAVTVGFEKADYDDGAWESASACLYADHTLVPQESRMLVFEDKAPVLVTRTEDGVLYDFGSNYVGYLALSAKGRAGDTVTLRFAQELNEDGSPRYALRANCTYEEEWVLAEGESHLDAFDYKAFRYAALLLPEGVEITAVSLRARHYPFTLARDLKPDMKGDERLARIWALCVNTLKYGVQEVIQDCMEREKGFYLGDGCYTALTHMILTGDDTIVRKLIDDAFSTSRINDTLVTCLDCSFMQEIAEYPLMLIPLVLWHYSYTKDKRYLENNYPKVIALLNAYRTHYEKDFILRELDKWCVVEWPKNFQHGYDVDIQEGKVCHEAHVSINAYYISAIRTANRMAAALGTQPYRDERPLLDAFDRLFYDAEAGLYRDGENTRHTSLVGNSFVYAFDLCRDEGYKARFLRMLEACGGIHSLSFFCTFPILLRLAKDGERERLRKELLDEGAWLRMLREDASTTFEGWGRDTKWNTSLFHLTMASAAAFMADFDLAAIL